MPVRSEPVSGGARGVLTGRVPGCGVDRQAGAVCGPLDTALPSSVPSLARSVPRSHLSASSAFPRLPAGRRMPEAEPPSLSVGRPRAPTRDG